MPVAVNCWVVPTAIDGADGVTEIETNVAAVTFKLVDDATMPEVAVMAVVPCAIVFARPGVAELVLMVATAGVPELHCTVPVMFCVVPSLKVPVAVNCCVTPWGREGMAGVTAIETRAAEVTVAVAEPVIEAEAAVIVVLPDAALDANP